MSDEPVDSGHSVEFYEKLWRAYGCFQGDFQDYVKTHFKRFCLTLDLLPRQSGLRILELGTSAPFPFTLMLRSRLPDVHVFINHEDATNPHGYVLLRASTGADEDIKLPAAGYNIETATWPHAANAFDVVLLTEVLEHLLLNPIAVFSETAHVLAPGGRFIVTTPNIACLESVQRMLDLQSPYTYGVYSKHGPYGRHNREFVPSEVEQLGRACGFETELLTTHDCYGLRCDVSEAATLLQKRSAAGQRRDLRGQVIFYVGRKTGAARGPFPVELFDYNPVAHRCRISLAPDAKPPCVSGDPPTLAFEILAVNEGEIIWQHSGDQPTRLGVQLVAEDGAVLARDWLRCELPREVRSGESVRISVQTFLPGPEMNLSSFIYRLDMVQEFVCWFADIPTGGWPLELKVARPNADAGWTVS